MLQRLCGTCSTSKDANGTPVTSAAAAGAAGAAGVAGWASVGADCDPSNAPPPLPLACAGPEPCEFNDPMPALNDGLSACCPCCCCCSTRIPGPRSGRPMISRILWYSAAH